MTSLLIAAIRKCEPIYVLRIMEETRKREITLNKEYLMTLERYYQTTQKGLISKVSQNDLAVGNTFDVYFNSSKYYLL